MAEEAGIYQLLWHPTENNITKAEQLIIPLQESLSKMKNDPERFKQHNPPNGWGDYEGFINFVYEYLMACIDCPESQVYVER